MKIIIPVNHVNIYLFLKLFKATSDHLQKLAFADLLILKRINSVINGVKCLGREGLYINIIE